MALPTPSFIDRDPQTIIDEMVAYYETQTGKTLQPAQIEMLLINMFAYRETLIRNGIQDASMQNLLAFSRAPMLDYLGELLGVTRLADTEAGTIMEFALVPGHGDVIIPAGIRISSNDGRAVFETEEDLLVNSAVDLITATVVCQSTGSLGNGYVPGTVTRILDPQPYLATASNTTTTAGGSDPETDDQLRARIKLAPEAFSNAGSKGAYKFFTLSAHPSIIDAFVDSDTPGTVQLYPLVVGGVTTPTLVLDAVLATCNAEKVRPLTDTVTAFSPTAVTYSINIDLTLLTDADADAVQAQVLQLVTAYADSKVQKLGQDIVREALVKLAMQDEVYKPVINQPSADVVISGSQFPQCTGIVVNVIGYSNA